MLIKTIPVGHLETNCYVVTDEQTLSCAVIDPGDESNTILDYIESNHLHVKAILITHGHFDHVTAAETVAEATGAPIWINEKDVNIGGSYDRLKFSASQTCTVHYYSEGDTVCVDGLTFTVMETPGHSKGSVTLRCGDALFTGDVLFRGSCGRTDFAGGDTFELMESLRRLNALPGNYEVYPGHMDSTTLDIERSTNRYIQFALENNGRAF
jgi:hydroxyacylglutathione hydrolase